MSPDMMAGGAGPGGPPGGGMPGGMPGGGGASTDPMLMLAQLARRGHKNRSKKRGKRSKK